MDNADIEFRTLALAKGPAVQETISIACPFCGNALSIPAAAFDPRRKACCSKCQKTFFLSLPPSVPEVNERARAILEAQAKDEALKRKLLWASGVCAALLALGFLVWLAAGDTWERDNRASLASKFNEASALLAAGKHADAASAFQAILDSTSGRNLKSPDLQRIAADSSRQLEAANAEVGRKSAEEAARQKEAQVRLKEVAEEEQKRTKLAAAQRAQEEASQREERDRQQAAAKRLAAYKAKAQVLVAEFGKLDAAIEMGASYAQYRQRLADLNASFRPWSESLTPEEAGYLTSKSIKAAFNLLLTAKDLWLTSSLGLDNGTTEKTLTKQQLQSSFAEASKIIRSTRTALDASALPPKSQDDQREEFEKWRANAAAVVRFLSALQTVVGSADGAILKEREDALHHAVYVMYKSTPKVQMLRPAFVVLNRASDAIVPRYISFNPKRYEFWMAEATRLLEAEQPCSDIQILRTALAYNLDEFAKLAACRDFFREDILGHKLGELHEDAPKNSATLWFGAFFSTFSSHPRLKLLSTLLELRTATGPEFRDFWAVLDAVGWNEEWNMAREDTLEQTNERLRQACLVSERVIQILPKLRAKLAAVRSTEP